MKRIIFSIFAIVLFALQLNSQAPNTISWQGIIQDDENNLLNTQTNLTVKLFDVAAGGTALWTETHNNVNIVDGLANLTLGSVTPLNLSFDSQYWLEITVGESTPMARIKLNSVPYSLYSKKSSGVIENDSIVLKDSLGTTRMVFNPNEGTFKMMNNDTTWYELQVASPPKKTEIINKDGKVIKTYADEQTGETVKEVVDFKTGLTEITRTLSKEETGENDVEFKTIEKNKKKYSGESLVSESKQQTKTSDNFEFKTKEAKFYSGTTLVKEINKETKVGFAGAYMGGFAGATSDETIKNYNENGNISSITTKKYNESTIASFLGSISGLKEIVENKFFNNDGVIQKSDKTEIEKDKDFSKTTSTIITKYGSSGSPLDWEEKTEIYDSENNRRINTIKNYIDGVLRSESTEESGSMGNYKIVNKYNAAGQLIFSSGDSDETTSEYQNKKVSTQYGGADNGYIIIDEKKSNDSYSITRKYINPDESTGMNILENYIPGGVGGKKTTKHQSPTNIEIFITEEKTPTYTTQEYSNQNLKNILEEYLGQVDDQDVAIKKSSIGPPSGTIVPSVVEVTGADGKIERKYMGHPSQIYGIESWNPANSSFDQTIYNPTDPNTYTNINQAPDYIAINGDVTVNGDFTVTGNLSANLNLNNAETNNLQVNNSLTFNNGNTNHNIDEYGFSSSVSEPGFPLNSSYNTLTYDGAMTAIFQSGQQTLGTTVRQKPTGWEYNIAGKSDDLFVGDGNGSIPQLRGYGFYLKNDETSLPAISIDKGTGGEAEVTMTRVGCGTLNISGGLYVGSAGTELVNFGKQPNFNAGINVSNEKGTFNDGLETTGLTVFNNGFTSIFQGTFQGGLSVTGGSVAISNNCTIGGDLNVSGTKNFMIDHPDDPEHKYLVHAAIESDQALNQYSGNIVTNENGVAVVFLPDYIEKINIDFRYQLTVIGEFAQAIISKKISNNQFEIKTDKPFIEVSWLINAKRNDEYMKINPFNPIKNK